MNRNPRSIAIALLLCLPVAPAFASDCAYKGRPISGVLKKKIGVFQAGGKWLKDLDSSEIAPGATVLDCNEELGIVKVTIAGAAQWVDRLALNIRPPGPKECLTRSVSRPADLTAPVSSGVGDSCISQDSK